MPELLDEVRAAGLPVELEVHGEPRELPQALDVSAYRVLQEGLSNVLRHAGAGADTVSLRHEPAALDRPGGGRRAASVPPAARADAVGGHGLARHPRAGRVLRRRGGARRRGPTAASGCTPASRSGRPVTAPVRVVLADDQEMVRAGLRMLWTSSPIWRWWGRRPTARGGRGRRRTPPDVVLMDVRMPRCDGIEAARRIVAEPRAPVIILTTFDDDASLAEALRAGVSGFLLKVAPPEQLLQAVRIVAAGQALLDPAVTLRVIELSPRPRRPTRRRGTARPPHAARDRRPPAGRQRAVQRGDRGRALPRRGDGEDARLRDVAKLDLRDRVQAVAFAFAAGWSRSPHRTREPRS